MFQNSANTIWIPGGEGATADIAKIKRIFKRDA